MWGTTYAASTRRALIGVAVIVACIAPATAPAQLTPSNAVCRSALGKGVEKLAQAVLRAQQSCHKRRARGTVPATVDCNDPFQSPSIDVIDHAADKLKSRALRQCQRAAVPAGLGYTVCPVPCAATIGDYASVADCLTCLTLHWQADAGAAAYGAPLGSSAAGPRSAVRARSPARSACT